jgi:hypothetical protein
MKANIFLRVAAVVTLLQCAGHILGRPWTMTHNVRSAAVVDAMKAYRFNVMGFERSYFDFYSGFGLVLGVYLLAQAAVLWNLAALAGSGVARIRPIIEILCVANLAVTVLEWRFLFTAPLIMSGVITLSLALAFVSAHARQAA